MIARRLTGLATTFVIVVATAVLSAWPTVRSLPEETAVVKLSFSHGGPRNCRTLSAEEMADLPENMRRKEVCERGRRPIYLELDLDGETVLAKVLPPSGIANDGPSRIYQRFQVPSGDHHVAIRLRIQADGTGFDFETGRDITLVPAQSFVIDFRAQTGGGAGGFVFN